MPRSFQVPVNLLRASRIMTFEPPPGVKANLVRTFGTVPAARMCKVGVVSMSALAALDVMLILVGAHREGKTVLPPGLVPCHHPGEAEI